MSIKIDKQTIYIGAGLTRVGWVVRDEGMVMSWHMEYDTAHKRAHDLKEQKEHRDGV
jgi:hypothetical protein